MAFKSYAEGRGFKNYHLQLPIAEFQNQIIRDGNQQAAAIKSRAEYVRQNRAAHLDAMQRSQRATADNREEIKRFRDKNLKDIQDAELRNLQTEIDSANRSGRGPAEESFLEKITPLLELGGKAMKMYGAHKQAEDKARYQKAHNVLVGTGLTTKQYNQALELKQQIFDETTEGTQFLIQLNEKLGRTGENVITTEHFRLLSDQTGEHELLLKQQLALNSFHKFDGYIKARQHEVDPTTGKSFAQVFDPSLNNDLELRDKAWNKMYSSFADEQGIKLNELPANVAGGSFSSRVQKLKDTYYGTAGRGDELQYQEQQKRDSRLHFEQSLFDVKHGDNPNALVETHSMWAHRFPTAEGKPNWGRANDELYVRLDEGIEAGTVGPADIQDVINRMGSHFGHGMMGRMVQLKHEAEVFRASKVGQQQSIEAAQQVELSNAMELHLNTNAEAAEIIQALAPQEQLEFFKSNGLNNKTASSLLSKMYGGLAANKQGHEIDQGGTFSIIKEWVPQILANKNEIAESDLKKVLGHEAAEQSLIAYATAAYNKQWSATGDGQKALDYAKATVDEILERGRFNINKDDVEINGEMQVKSIDGTGLRQYSFGSFHQPGEIPQLDITKARVTATFTGKSEAEGLEMVTAISNPEQAAAIMPRSVIEDSMVGGEFNLNLFGRHAAVQRAVEETGASVSYLADQLLQGYGLEGLNPRDVATPEELKTLGQFSRSTYKNRSTHQSSISQEVNQTQLAMATTGNSGRSTGPHLDFGATDAAGNEIDPNKYLNSLYVGDTPLKDSFPETSGYGWRSDPFNGSQTWHAGRDIGTPIGTELTVKGGELIDQFNDEGGWGHSKVYRMPDGGTLRLSHLQGGN